jgi:hypothetical protein
MDGMNLSGSGWALLMDTERVSIASIFLNRVCHRCRDHASKSGSVPDM